MPLTRAKRQWIWAISAIVIAALLFVGLWTNRHHLVEIRTVDELAPTIYISVDQADAQNANLAQVGQIIQNLNMVRFPVTMSRVENSDFVIRLASYVGVGGKTKIEVSLYDANRDMVVTESVFAGDLADPQSISRLAQKINGRFLSVTGFVPASFERGRNFAPLRRQIYGCYKLANQWARGKVNGVPDFDAVMKCLDPTRVTEPRDKVLIHLMRSSIIANSVSGVIPTKARYTMDEARDELTQAETVYPDDTMILGQRIVLEWRDPNRDSDRLRKLVSAARAGIMTSELRYDVAMSYAYFLGDWATARQIANDDFEDQQGMIHAVGNFAYYIYVPEPFVKGDYRLATDMLEKTGGKLHPSHLVFALAIGCASGNSKQIAEAQRLIGSSPVLSPKSVISYARGRRYAPELDNALTTALSNHRCRPFTMGAPGA